MIFSGGIVGCTFACPPPHELVRMPNKSAATASAVCARNILRGLPIPPACELGSGDISEHSPKRRVASNLDYRPVVTGTEAAIRLAQWDTTGKPCTPQTKLTSAGGIAPLSYCETQRR
jgi:hypothetical protein